MRAQTGGFSAFGAACNFGTAESQCRFNALERLASEQIKETLIIWADLIQNRARTPAAVGFSMTGP
jgi:hypothetical protein